ncbi:hypothetical protein OQY15_14575 [Pedobacter sp. MC2016-15]|uniref:hypothetical protein n=1 Tax=Pedobacter sp. MC2016-15 TaxID=2994473 RepID=UPI002246627D|nr:hypothetical protein [Pedobacter sp. MC2016-15]MCX2480323.1 hypothetical protein [Pedobacter sp. MC2016-15]
MKKRLTFLLSGFLTVSSASVFAQAAYFMVYDAKGQVTAKNEYVDIQGSPYVNPNWSKGTFTLANGKTYKDMDIKYDLVKDKMYVMGDNDESIALLDQVRDFSINVPLSGTTVTRHYRTGYANIPSTTNTYYFEVLADGKTQFLKRTSKNILTNKEYNSATATKSFEEITRYYIYKDGKGTAVKKDKKAILAALGNKQSELETYIKAEKLNLKNDADVVTLITYYNTL